MREIWKMSTKVSVFLGVFNLAEIQGSNDAVNIRTTFNLFSVFSVPTKVKKTDLPVIPPESEILPSLDDSDDNFSDDLEDDEDLGKIIQASGFLRSRLKIFLCTDDQDEMMADEPLETLEEEDEEEDYESEEDTPVIDQDFMNDGTH